MISSVQVLLALLLAVVAIGVGIVGVTKHDYHQCLQWQEQATMYEGFYLTEPQKHQCDYFNIIIK